MKTIKKLLGVLAVFALIISACNKDNNNPLPVVVEDGYYIVGGSVANDSMKLSGMMNPGYYEDECCHAALMENLYEKYFYATAGDGGFVVMQQAGDQTITWGIDGDWTVVRQDTVMKANVVKDGGNFTVPSDGFYLFVLDMNTMKAYLVKVEYWALIGAATPGGWSSDDNQHLAVTNMDKTNATFEIQNIKLLPGEFKFRFNSWWQYYDADPNAEAEGDPKFFTNLGGTLDKLMPGGANLVVDEAGYYTVTLNYDLENGYTATLTKTGDVETEDFSQDTISLIGSNIGYLDDNNNPVFVGSWTDDIDLAYTGGNPVFAFEKDNVILTEGSEFKFRLNHNWDRNWGYEDVTLAGDVADIVNAAGKGNNFKSTSNKIYNVKFEINGQTYEVTVTFTYVSDYTPPAGDDPSQHTYSFIGSAFYVDNTVGNDTTSWGTDFDMTYQGQDNDGNFVFTYSGLNFIGGGEFKIRQDHDWGTNWGWGINITGDTGNFEDPGNGNIKVINDAKYDVTFTMDADFNVVSLDFTAAK